jgi:hypothetical protein
MMMILRFIPSIRLEALFFEPFLTTEWIRFGLISVSLCNGILTVSDVHNLR